MMTKLYVNAVTFFSEFKRDERGVTAIEYGLIAVAMAVGLTVIFASDGNFLSGLTDMFENLGKELKNNKAGTL